MATNLRISDLQNAFPDSLESGDLIPIARAGETRKLIGLNIKNSILGTIPTNLANLTTKVSNLSGKNTSTIDLFFNDSVYSLSASVIDQSINTQHLTNSGVTTDKIATGAVTPVKLSTGAPSWTSTGLTTIQNILTVNRGDFNQEGGEIRLARAVDNNIAWHIDAFGTSTTPSLRIFDGPTQTVRVFVDGSNGFVNIGSSTTPSSLLTVTGSYTTGNGPNLTLINTSNNSTNAFGPLVRFYSGRIGEVPFAVGVRQNESRFIIARPDSPFTEFLTVNSSGNVGIGTATPSERLTVSGNINCLQTISVSSLNVTHGSDVPMTSTSNGQIRIQGNGYAGAIALDSVGMHIYHNSSQRNIIFGTDELARMVITSSGEVNVTDIFTANRAMLGTTGTPTTKLDIVGDTVTDTEVNYSLFRGPGSSQPGIYLGGNSTTASSGTTARYSYIRSQSLNGTGRALFLQTGTNTSIAIDNTGNVGIGTTTPGAKLTVAGTISAAALTFNEPLDITNNTIFSEPSRGSTDARGVTVYNLASYRSASSNQEGCIVFEAPDTTSTVMHRFEIEGMLYAGGPTFKCVVQGYRTSGAWSNTSKINLGIADIPIRWGVSSDGRNCLIIGQESGLALSYPHITISRAMFSHSNARDAEYRKNWSVSVVTSLAGYTNVTSPLANSRITTDISGNALTALTANLAGNAVTADTATLATTIADNTVTNSKVTSNAAIAGTKISPNFGSQNIVTTGNVGIGTSSPAFKLDVTGDIRATGTITGTTFSTSGPNIGRVALQSGNSANSGYVEWFRPNGTTRIGYMGWGAGGVNNLNINLENSANLVVTNGSVGIGTTTPVDTLDVAGNLRVNAFTGGNPIRFTSGWTGFPGSATNHAEIANDIGTFKSLMIVGNRSNDAAIRRVSVWDRLDVNGDLNVVGTISGTLANNIVGTTALNAGAVTTKLGSEVGAFAFRNKIINGDFDIWQRGVSFSNPVSNTFTADRWAFLRFSGAVSSISRQNFSLGQTQVPGEPTHFLRTIISSPGDLSIEQRIESVRTLAGKTVTYSFWIKASAATTLEYVLFSQIFGTGGSPSSIVYTAGSANTAVSTSWTKITGTVTLPSIVSKTIGTNNNDYLGFRIDFNQSFTGTVDIAQVQLEEGSYATPFEQRPIGTVLALCQRYYEKSYSLETAPRTVTTNGAVLERFAYVDSLNGEYYTVRFQTEKRTGSPTISLISQKDGALDRWTDTSSSGSPNLFVQTTSGYTNSKSFAVNIRFVSSAHMAVGGHWTADAEL
jgi:hypothetical protein